MSCVVNANSILLKGAWKLEEYATNNMHEPYDLLNLKLEISKNNDIHGSFEYFYRWFSRIEDLKEFDSHLQNKTFYFTFNSNFGGKNGKVKIIINQDCSLDWTLIKEPDGEYYVPRKAYLKVVDLETNTNMCQYKDTIPLSIIEHKLKHKKYLKIYTNEFFQQLVSQQPLNNQNLTTYNNIAYYLQKAGANKEAIYLLEKILQQYPKRTVAYYNLGDAYWAVGDKEKAKQVYRTYIKQMKAKGKEKRIPKIALQRAQ